MNVRFGRVAHSSGPHETEGHPRHPRYGVEKNNQGSLGAPGRPTLIWHWVRFGFQLLHLPNYSITKSRRQSASCARARRAKQPSPGAEAPGRLTANATFRSAEGRRAARSAERHGKISCKWSALSL